MLFIFNDIIHLITIQFLRILFSCWYQILINNILEIILFLLKLIKLIYIIHIKWHVISLNHHGKDEFINVSVVQGAFLRNEEVPRP